MTITKVRAGCLFITAAHGSATNSQFLGAVASLNLVKPANENGRRRPPMHPAVLARPPGHKNDPLYRTRRLMTRAWERLSDRQRDKLLCALAEGDPTGEVGAAILGKELLREVHAAPTLQQAHWSLVRFYGYVSEAEVPELTRLATTISRWEREVLSYHVTGISTGPVEA